MKKWWLRLKEFWKANPSRQNTLKQLSAITAAVTLFALLTVNHVIIAKPTLIPPQDFAFLAETRAASMSADALEQRLRTDASSVEGLVIVDGLHSVVVMHRGIDNDRYVQDANTADVERLADELKIPVRHVKAVVNNDIWPLLNPIWKVLATGLLIWLGLFLFRGREREQLPSRIAVVGEKLSLGVTDLSLRTGLSPLVICWSFVGLLLGANLLAMQEGYFNEPSFRAPPTYISRTVTAAPYQAQRLAELHPEDLLSVTLIDDANVAYLTIKRTASAESQNEKESFKNYSVFFGNTLSGEGKFKLFAEVAEKGKVSIKHQAAEELQSGGMTFWGRLIFTGILSLAGLLAIKLILMQNRPDSNSEERTNLFASGPRLQPAGGSRSGLRPIGRHGQPANPNDTPISFKDVAGCDEAVDQLKIVVKKVTRPRLHRLFGAPVPRGICFFGPPGTGKTTLARALSGEMAGLNKRCYFEAFAGSQFVEMYVGKGALRVREAYTKARAEARRNGTPSIIFIDEFDSLARKRSEATKDGGDQEYTQTINQLLTEMDGFANRGLVITIAATNRLDTLDPAVLRPGRLDLKIEIGLPDTNGRRQIFSLYLNKLKVILKGSTAAQKETYKLALIDSLAKRAVDFSGAEIESATKEAATIAVERTFGHLVEDITEEQEQEDGWKDRIIVSEEDLFDGVERVAFGLKLNSKLRTDEERWATAIHEIGHAVAAKDPVHLISIARTEKSLGMVQTIPAEDRLDWSKPQLLDRLRMILAGRAAQKVILGIETAGASDDFNKAGVLARQMVGTLGMSSDLGNCALVLDKNGFPAGQVSNYLLELFDRAWMGLIVETQKEAEELICKYRRPIVAAARILYREERMKGESLVGIFADSELHGPALDEDRVPEAVVAAPLVSGVDSLEQVPGSLASSSEAAASGEADLPDQAN